ncbi:MAG: DUF6600 domain-containing protein [Pseudomonadota bacterium]
MTAHAQGRADPPSRVGRLNHAEGAVAFAPAGDNEWIDAARNRPLVRGDKLWTDKGSRAEVQVGSSALRLDGSTHVEILALDDQTAQLSVSQGTVYLRVRSLPEGENYEIDTPNLAYRAAYPGDYRIDVDAARGTTRVTIHSGTGTVYGDGGQVLALGGGQQVMFRDKTLAQVGAQESPPQDNFDRWAADRNRREDQSISARYVPREVVGYQELDANGQWSQDAAHGVVWTPRTVPANWAPYRNGRWEWIAPWGWTWIDEAPWGFAPFHYGRWTQISSRWVWVPGRIGLKPVYAPALVAFIGGSGAGWKSALGPGRSGVTWFPLAPGEPWIPAHAASPVYMSNVNRDLTMLPNAAYAFQRNPDALSALAAEDFHRGKPGRAGWMQVAANMLTSAQIVPPPAMPQRGTAQAPHAVATRATPPPPVDVRPVVAAATPAAVREQVQAQAQALQKSQAQARIDADAKQQAQAKIDAQVRADAQAKADAQVKADAQARLAAQAATQRQVQEQQRVQQVRQQAQAEAKTRSETVARRAESAKREQAAQHEQTARRVEAAKREQLAERESQARRAETARRADQARRRDELAKRDLARKEQIGKQQLLAKRAEKQRAEQQARKAEQAKRDAAARREEQQRRDLHDQHVAQARKAADQEVQALRETRARREEALAKREAQEREQAQREAELRQQQALAEQWRRDRAAWEQQQRDRGRGRPDLREVDRRNRSPESRGYPIIGQPMS